MPIDPFYTALASTALEGTLEAGVSAWQSRQQFNRQRQLMDISQQNQMALNEQGRQIQMQMWKDTNYPAQVAMLKEAGLNPAILYAKGGMGGTTGSQGGGQASSGQAQMAHRLDLSSIGQMGLLASQIKKNEAEARNQNAEAQSKEDGGYQSEQARAYTQNLKATYDKIGAEIGTEQAKKLNYEADTNLKNLDLAIKQATKENVIEMVNQELKKLQQTNELMAIEIMSNQMDLDAKETLLANLIEQSNLNLAMTRIEIEAKQAGIDLMDEQKKKIRAEIAQGWKSLDLQGEQLEITRDGQKITMRGQDLDYKQGIFGIKMNAYNQKQMNKTMEKVAHINGIYGIGKEVTGALADAYTAPMKAKAWKPIKGKK